MPPPNNRLYLTGYTLLYAALISCYTLLMAPLATVAQIERSVYDYFQSFFAIDTHREAQHSPYRAELEDMAFINLDGAMLDPNSRLLQRPLLLALLDSLETLPERVVLFLDFYFIQQNGTQAIDSQLIQRMQSFQDRLVLPYEVPSGSQPFNALETHVAPPQLLYEPPHRGYLDYRRSLLKGENEYRYIQFGHPGDTTTSAVQALLNALRTQHEIPSVQSIPAIFEINYLLRNRPSTGANGRLNELRAVGFTDASTIIGRDTPFRTSAKVVFIGQFGGATVPDELTVDLFPTPVEEQMQGIYLIVNSYLNAITNTYIRSAAYWQVFIINIFLGGGMWLVLEYQPQQLSRYQLFGSCLLLLLLMLWFHRTAIRFPFTFTLIGLMLIPNFKSFFFPQQPPHETHTT